MKVIKASVDLETWAIQHTCGKCQSVLEICAKDIRYNYTEGHYAVCVLCSNRMSFKRENIPEIIKADVSKHRTDPSHSSDNW